MDSSPFDLNNKAGNAFDNEIDSVSSKESSIKFESVLESAAESESESDSMPSSTSESLEQKQYEISPKHGLAQLLKSGRENSKKKPRLHFIN